MAQTKKTHQHQIILRAVLVERRTQADVARQVGISRARVGQILADYDIHIRPIMEIGNHAKIREILPEWEGGAE
jgi:monomeric isocitrate dehydrogenase